MTVEQILLAGSTLNSGTVEQLLLNPGGNGPGDVTLIVREPLISSIPEIGILTGAISTQQALSGAITTITPLVGVIQEDSLEGQINNNNTINGTV